MATERGYSIEAARRAAALASGSPAPEAWARLLSLAAGGVGAGLLASALVTFFAANWERMGRFARLGLLEVTLVVAVIVAARWFGRLAGRLSLDLGYVALGALLAVFGQTYQTGADPWQLFLTWAALGVPWVLIARAEELWLLETLVLGAGVARLLEQRPHVEEGAVALALWALGSLAVALWEVQARRARPWLRARWLPRVWASLAGSAVCVAFVVVLSDHDARLLPAALAVVASLAAVAWAYHRRSIELYMQTVALGTGIVVLTSALARVVLSGSGDPFGWFLLLTIAVVGQTAGAASWLRREARRARGAVT
jgi:uncharacterized membrane protein